jgi:hypothetical protein
MSLMIGLHETVLQLGLDTLHHYQAICGHVGAGSSNLRTLTFPDFVSLIGGPSYGGPHLSVTQSQGRLSQRIPFRSRAGCPGFLHVQKKAHHERMWLQQSQVPTQSENRHGELQQSLP